MVQRDPQRIHLDRLTGRPVDIERNRIDPGPVRFCRGAHTGRAGHLEIWLERPPRNDAGRCVKMNLYD